MPESLYRAVDHGNERLALDSRQGSVELPLRPLAAADVRREPSGPFHAWGDMEHGAGHAMPLCLSVQCCAVPSRPQHDHDLEEGAMDEIRVPSCGARKAFATAQAA